MEVFDLSVKKTQYLMPFQFTNQDTGRVVKTYASYANINIRFFDVVCDEDVRVARRFVESTKTSNKVVTWSVVFGEASFESVDVELELASVLCGGEAVMFFFCTTYMSRRAWEVYFSHFLGNRKMNRLTFYGMTRDKYMLGALLEFLPGMKLTALTLCRTDVMCVGDQLLRCLCGTLEELYITGCNLIGGASLLDFKSIFGGGKGLRLQVLELGLFCTAEIVDFLPGLLSECPKLKSVSISPGPHGVWEFRDDEVKRSIVSHTSIGSINGCMDSTIFLKLTAMIMDKKRLVWRKMMAFLTRRVDRLGTKCVMRRLFRDADGLIWSFLV